MLQWNGSFCLCLFILFIIEASSFIFLRRLPPCDPPHLLSRSGHDTSAFPQQTPHSGRHFWPTHPSFGFQRFRRRRRRFTEGWYYRLTLEDDTSFAFILSIEDPGRRDSPRRLVCIQVVGPNDEYLVQGSADDSLLWAWKQQQGVGCTFAWRKYTHDNITASSTALDRETWKRSVESGFQILPTRFLGRVHGRDGTVGSSRILDPNDCAPTFNCSFDFTVDPLVGWGGRTAKDQRSTAGWLSHWPIFEPHWQITLADARATGTVQWKDRFYNFTNAPLYAEKNWGAALPEKWFWTQCNSFPGYDQLSVVAGGGIRKVPLGKREALGMVSLHWKGQFFEAVPWMGGMAWNVDPWGRWKLTGNSTLGDRPFAVEVIYECNPDVGLVFRAPTPEDGMVRFCKDTFDANCVLNLWKLERNNDNQWVKVEPPLINQATSNQGGAEVGGGPWWDTWEGESKVKVPIQRLLRIPFYWSRLRARIWKAK